MTQQWRRHQNGRVKPPQRRFCARRFDRSSAESEAMEVTSRLQLIAASCSAIPNIRFRFPLCNSPNGGNRYFRVSGNSAYILGLLKKKPSIFYSE
ncbi:hypothetical protein HUG20_15295 [Salicibibacter cibi]|uniref:Uncharacterized protein n=1 Tax=Salicibibacter cibi TaxID=2743001 RepID=A0A7T6ZD10_9BACI|nr:hypothetical protein [Salicibibacter cibi]QQK81127.1 hypothetical protein HUG20_15295 [Salicibibacter cibi]